MIHVTENAQRELERIMREEGRSHTGIRLGVRGGGCSGFSYVMDFEKEMREQDKVVNEDRVPIFIDPKSFMYLDGLSIDFSSDILNRGFKFQNPNATQSCGCGTSFAV